MFKISDYIILYWIIPSLIFTPYYEPLPPLWGVVANSIYSFWGFLIYLKIFNPGAAHGLLPDELIHYDSPKVLPLV